MATDTSGNQKVDFVWGNFPMQPNSDRTDGTPVVVVANNASENKQWSGYSTYPSARLDAALDNHATAEAGWGGYPNFTAAAGNYIVTAASGDGTTVTYTSQNYLAVGDTVNITGLSASAYNLTGATVASVTANSFTVTDTANAGLVTGQYGKVQSSTALTDADGAGIGYIIVPNVKRLTTAAALDSLKDAGYEAARITTAAAATVQISKSYRAGGGGLTKITTSEAHGFLAGDVVVVAGTNGNPDLEGTWTIVDVPTPTTFRYQTTTSGTITEADDTGTCKVAALAGKIWKQSTAAGTGSVSTTASITITPYAA